MHKPYAPYGLEIIRSCLACPIREDSLFCRLDSDVLTELNAIRQVSVYPKGAVLFVEGQPGRGLYILCSGRAKLSANSVGGRSVIVRVAESGEVLGLSAVMANQPYEVSAEIMEPSQVNFITRPDFLRFLETCPDVSLRVSTHLSMELRRAYRQVARIALAPSAQAKLAGLLLEWAKQAGNNAEEGSRFQMYLTHEEVGELIGSSRETVTRLLSEFRGKGLIQYKGTIVSIPDPGKLEELLP